MVSQWQREGDALRIGRTRTAVLGFGVALQNRRRRHVSERRLIVRWLHHTYANANTDADADTNAKRGDLHRLLGRAGQVVQLRMALVVDCRVRVVVLMRMAVRVMVVRRQTRR